MSIPKSKIIAAQLQGTIGVLERTPASEKKNLITLELALQFNETLNEIATAYPDLADSLPRALSTRGPMLQLGKVPATFLDLEIATEQILNLLNLVQE